MSRIANYEAGINPARISAILTASKPGMVQRFGSWMSRMQVLYASLMAVLAHEVAVQTTAYANYYAYINEVASKLDRIPGGHPTDTEVSLITAKWTTYGLDDTVLDKVLLNCFGMTAI